MGIEIVFQDHDVIEAYPELFSRLKNEEEQISGLPWDYFYPCFKRAILGVYMNSHGKSEIGEGNFKFSYKLLSLEKFR